MVTITDNHWLGLGIGIIGWILGWYSLVLVAAKTTDPFPAKPNTYQWYGIGFAVGLAVLSWGQRFTAIQGEEQE